MSTTVYPPRETRPEPGSNGSLSPDQEWEPISFLNLLAVVLRRRRVFLAVCAATVLLAVAKIVLGGPSYTAHTTVVPAPSRNESRDLMMGGRLPAGLAALAVGSNQNQRLVGAIARSEAVRDSIVRRLVRPGGPTREEVRGILKDQTTVKVNNDGSVVVEVTASSPRLAAAVAAQYPGLINDIAGQLSRDAAARKRAFLETQLTTVGEQLSRAEAELLSFQQEHDLPEAQQQAEQTVQAAAELQRGIFALELMVRRLRMVATPDNPQLRTAEADLAARREQLRRLTGPRGEGGALFVPLGSSAELKLASVRLLRDFTKYEQMFGALTVSMAQAQVEANENLPVVSVLDEAVPPEKPSSSGPVTILLLALFVGAGLGTVVVFAQEFVASARRAPGNAGFFDAWSAMRGGLRRSAR